MNVFLVLANLGRPGQRSTKRIPAAAVVVWHFCSRLKLVHSWDTVYNMYSLSWTIFLLYSAFINKDVARQGITV